VRYGLALASIPSDAEVSLQHRIFALVMRARHTHRLDNAAAGSAHGQCDVRSATMAPVLNLSKPKTPGQWMVHIVAALIALFLIAWLLRLYIL
jgi:hypothetical protein